MVVTSYLDNLGESQNKGYEAYLSERVYNNNATRSYINVFGSIAHNKNRLKKIANSLKSKNDQADFEMNQDDALTTPSVRYEVGQSMNAIWAVKSMGIDPETGKEVYVKKDGTMTYDWNSADLVVCGDALPTISGNFGVNGEYKGFGLNATFTWRYGGQLYNTTLLDKVENANVYYQVDKRVLTERWSKPGDISRFKSISDNSSTKPTSRFVEDNNTLTFSSLSLYYDFRDTKVVKNTFFERFKLTLFMNDIATISSIEIERGTDNPFARSFSLQFQATF